LQSLLNKLTFRPGKASDISILFDPVGTRKQPQKKNTLYKSRSKMFKLNPRLFSNVIAKSNSQPIPSKTSIDTEKLILKLVLVYIQEDKIGDYFKEIKSFLTLEAEAGAKHIFLLERRPKSAVKYRSIKTSTRIPNSYGTGLLQQTKL
jgi:hypothetical protein